MPSIGQSVPPVKENQTSIAGETTEENGTVPLDQDETIAAPQAETVNVKDEKESVNAEPIDAKIPLSQESSTIPTQEVTPPAPISSENIIYDSSKVALDGAIAASIATCALENKIKAVASSILLIGGGSAITGLGAFLTERSIRSTFASDVETLS